MIGGRPAEILLAEGQVTRVFLRPDRGVFCELALRHYSNGNGTPLLATVRLCSTAHGAGWGDWWVPDIGTDLIAYFPGVGGDLDEGRIFGVISSREEPPVAGLKGPLGLGRRVYKGRPETAHDWHFQSDLDHKIDGNLDHEIVLDETRVVGGDRGRTVQGSETIEIVGPTARTHRDDLSEAIEGSVTQNIDGDETGMVGGDASRTVGGTETITNTGVFARTLAALGSWVSAVKLSLLAPIVEIGLQSGTFQKLMNEAAMAAYNQHTHPGSPNVPPDIQMVADTHTTISLKAS